MIAELPTRYRHRLEDFSHKMKKQLFGILALLIPFFSGCEKVENTSFSEKDSEKSALSEELSESLVVLESRCIGCGKCARLDAEHFAMSGRKAIVISTENTNSQETTRAMQSCPVRAISRN